MFLEMKNIRKHYGEGENRVEVLKGIDIEIEKGKSAFYLVLPVQANQRYSILSVGLMKRMKVT